MSGAASVACLVALVITQSSMGLAQTPGRPSLAPSLRGNAFQRYAFHIQTKADSAALVWTEVRDGPAASTNPEDLWATLGRILTQGYQRADRFAGDFDAVQPAPGYDRVHQQLVETLRAHVASLRTMAGLYTVSCDSERRAGLSCDLDGRRLAASRRSLYEVTRAAETFEQYLESRGRAGRMLTESGVTLPGHERLTPK